MTFLLQTIIVLVQIVIGFYGFWLVWRVLLPWLPGPEDNTQRIAPYAMYFTDPFVDRLASWLRLSRRLIAVLGLVSVAVAQAALQRAASVL